MTMNRERILIEVDLEYDPKAKCDEYVYYLMFPDSTEFSTFLREGANTVDGFWSMRRLEWHRDKESEIIWYELGEGYFINPQHIMYYKLFEARWATMEELEKMMYDDEEECEE